MNTEATSNVIPKSLLISFIRLWPHADVSEDWKNATVTFTFKRDKKKYLKHYRVGSLISIPGKLMEQTILETRVEYEFEMYPCGKEGKRSLDYIWKNIASSSREMILPLCLALVGHI